MATTSISARQSIEAKLFVDLYRAPVFGGTPQAVVRNIDTGITFSPDGKRIAYVRENVPDLRKFRLLVSSAEGTGEKIIVEGPMSEVPWIVCWSPDGRQIAEIINQSGDVLTAIQLLDVSSGKSNTLVGFKDLEIEDAVWTADGRGLLVGYYAKGSTGTQIGFVSKRDGQFHVITKDTNTYQALTISSDGKSLAAVQQKFTFTLHILPATGFTGNTPNPALPQIKNPFRFGWANREDLYISDIYGSLVRVSVGGDSKSTLFSDPNAMIYEIDYSVGRSVFFSWEGHGGNNVNIWRADADGSNQTQLTFGKRDVIPRSSPDGKSVYYLDWDAKQIKRVPSEGGTSQIVPGTAISNTMIGSLSFSLSADGKAADFLLDKGWRRPKRQTNCVGFSRCGFQAAGENPRSGCTRCALDRIYAGRKGCCVSYSRKWRRQYMAPATRWRSGAAKSQTSRQTRFYSFNFLLTARN